MRIAKKATAGCPIGFLENDRELGVALVHALNLPLTALRASMEGLIAELEGASVGKTIPLVLDEVDRLERNVQDLIEYTTPTAPRPLRCTLEEITTSAREGLSTTLRPRVVQARHNHGAGMVVDGPLLSRCLRRLIENALEAGSPSVLVVSRRNNTGASFAVVDAAPEELDVEWARQAFHSARTNHLGLGLSLVERDVNLMGGSFKLSVTAWGSTYAELDIPDAQLEKSGVSS